MTEETPKTKKKKAKGPIRFEAIVPFAIVAGLIVAYMLLFFETHLRMGFEYGATQVHGAEVNVGKVDLHYLLPGITITKIDITDKNKPTRNIASIGEIKVALLWDALLRGKLVIEESSVNGIHALTPREKAGYVLPPEKAQDSVGGRLESSLKKKAEEQISGNVLGDISEVLSGKDPVAQLEDIKATLKTEERTKELEKALKEKEAVWKKRLKELPQSKEFEDLANRAKKLKFNTGNPAQFAKDLDEMQKIIKEGDKKIKTFEKASKDLQGDVNGFNKSLKELEALAKQDAKDLQKRLNLPEINTSELSKSLFGEVFKNQIATVGKYAAMGREHMPTKKKNSKDSIIKPKARGEGTNVKYPITVGYPLFWLIKSSISSKATDDKFSGNISGLIQNFTSAPRYLGKPATISMKGDFPNLAIYGIDTLITVDHTTDSPSESLRGVVASFPVPPKKLSDSKDVKLHLTKATGQARFTGKLEDKNIYFKMINDLNDPEFDISAKSKILDETLKDVIAGLPTLNIESTAKGNLSDLRIDIRSNLGKELAKGIQAQVQKRIDEAKQKVQAFVDETVKAEKAKLEKQYAAAKSQVDNAIGKQKKEVDKVKKEAEKQMSSKKKKAEKQGSKQIEKEAKKLLDGLGF